MSASIDALRGVFTALVTPMNRDGSIDFGALDTLVDSQLAARVQGLVPCGTTGESATMDTAEREKVITAVVKRAGGSVPVIAGTGTQATTSTIEGQRRAKDLGASHGLVVTPFYNKPTQEGLYKHYAKVADSVDLPVVIYNVPARTGCDIKPDTVARLSKVPGIVGIKEATADLDRVPALRHGITTRFALLSGDDATACAFTLMGGDGVISVASNVAPADMVAMTNAARDNDVKVAREHHNKLRNLLAALFLESNPIPVKAAMAMQKQIQETYRLPLCEMSPAHRNSLEEVMRAGRWL